MASGFFKARNGITVGSASADPSPAINGDIYYNTVSNTYRAYQDGAWANLGAGGGGGVGTYANFASLPSPSVAGNGGLGITLDTNILYESNGTVWMVLATPNGGGNSLNSWSGYFGTASSWSTASATYVDPVNTGGNTLTTRVMNGLSVMAAASNVCGITWTPQSATAIYLIYAQVGLYSNTPTSAINFQMTDGTNIISNPAGFDQSASAADSFYTGTIGGLYTPGSTSPVTVKLQLAAPSGGTSFIEAGESIANSVEWTIVEIDLAAQASQLLPVTFKAHFDTTYPGMSNGAAFTSGFSVAFDSNSGFNDTTGAYTVPNTGYYIVGFSAQNATGQNQFVYIAVNGGSAPGANYFLDNTTADDIGAGSQLLFLNKGDVLTWISGTPNPSATWNFPILWVTSVAFNNTLQGPKGSTNGSAFAYFASSIVNTQSTAITSSTYGTFSNSPALTFIPSVSGIYKVSCPANLNLNASSTISGQIANAKIFNTSGGGTLLQNNEGLLESQVSSTVEDLSVTTQLEATYVLTAGVQYVFDIQGKVSGSQNFTLDGSNAQFFMKAEGVGLLGQTDQTRVAALIGMAGTQSVNAPAQINLDTVIADTNNAYNPSTGIYTVPSSGWYDMTFQGSTESGVHDNFTVYIYRNASLIAYNILPVASTPNIGIQPTPSCSIKYLLQAGDQITLQVGNQNGNTTNWGGDVHATFFAINGIGTTGVSRIGRSNSTGSGSTNSFSTSLAPIVDTSSSPLSVTVVANGGDVEVGMINDGSGNTGGFYIDQSPTDSGLTVNIYRDGTLIYSEFMYLQTNETIEIHQHPVNQIRFIDTPAAGSHTYTVQAVTNNNPRTQNTVSYSQLYARPMA